jgi:hypothetical protein
MKSRKFQATFVCAVTAIAATSMAHADGVCNAGYRDTTAAERATMTSILEAAKKSLPPAPAGWMLVGDDQVSVPKTLCRDYERAPWNYEYTRYYQRIDDQEAREKVITDAAAANAAAMKQKQPRLDAVMARMDKLSKTYAAQAQKGDTEHAAATYTELTKTQAEYEKILKEGDSDQQMAAAQEKASRDRQMNITVQINRGGETPGTNAKNLPLPPGARAASHWLTNGRDPHEDRALVLVGQWTPGAENHWQPARRAGVAVQSAHVISISVVADSERVAPTVAAIDVKGLAAAVLK